MGSVCSRNPIVLNHSPSQINEYSRNSDIRKKYEFVSILGSGSFGKVRLYRDRKCKGMKYVILREYGKDLIFTKMEKLFIQNF